MRSCATAIAIFLYATTTERKVEEKNRIAIDLLFRCC